MTSRRVRLLLDDEDKRLENVSTDTSLLASLALHSTFALMMSSSPDMVVLNRLSNRCLVRVRL